MLRATQTTALEENSPGASRNDPAPSTTGRAEGSTRFPHTAITKTEIETQLKLALSHLGVPWNWWGWVFYRRLEKVIEAQIEKCRAELGGIPAWAKNDILVDAIETTLSPYRNRLTLPAYTFLLGSVGFNAFIVRQLRDYPGLAAFAATFGGILSGALGFQVIARLQAWAKQVSSNDGSLKSEQIPFNCGAINTWRRSQQMKNDLSRDGRNIRKDSWLQLHARLEKALSLEKFEDAVEAVADALIDHRQTYGEVHIDYWLAREFHRNLKARFANEVSFQAIRKVFFDTAPRHCLPIEDLERMLVAILRPETWRGDALFNS